MEQEHILHLCTLDPFIHARLRNLHAYVHTWIHTYIHTHMNLSRFLALLDNYELETGIAETVTAEEVSAYAYIHTYIHTYLHTHICACIW